MSAPGESASRPPVMADLLRELHKIKRLADGAIDQVAEADFARALDGDESSIATVVKHLAGNLHSRWTDFLTRDGEKPDRNRDGEFELGPGDTRAHLLARWEEGWRLLLAALEPLGAEDLARVVTIRGEPHSVLQAVLRQVSHYAYHTGQIVFLARHLAGPAWRSLSIPRGRSQDFEVAKDGVRYIVEGDRSS